MPLHSESDWFRLQKKFHHGMGVIAGPLGVLSLAARARGNATPKIICADRLRKECPPKGPTRRRLLRGNSELIRPQISIFFALSWSAVAARRSPQPLFAARRP